MPAAYRIQRRAARGEGDPRAGKSSERSSPTMKPLPARHRKKKTGKGPPGKASAREKSFGSSPWSTKKEKREKETTIRPHLYLVSKKRCWSRLNKDLNKGKKSASGAEKLQCIRAGGRHCLFGGNRRSRRLLILKQGSLARRHGREERPAVRKR